MKLSVKWLAGLAVLVLAVVAVVGTTSATKAASGSIYVANEWSNLTNESPAPSGFVSTGTVYSTYDTSGRIIQTSADIVKVVAVDTDLNPSTPTTVTNSANITVTSGGDGDDQITASAGLTAVIELTGLGSTAPIAGDLASVQANTSILAGANELVGDEISITNFFAGSGSGAPWILVTVNVDIDPTITSITYNTSTAGTASIRATSDLVPSATPVTVTANETGLGTGRYEAWFRIVESTVTAPGGNGQTLGAPANIRANAGQVTFAFTDNEANAQSSTVTLDTTPPTNSITGPVDGSATQNQRPTFSGSISESGSGLDISEIDVRYDNSTSDADNSSIFVVDTTTGSFTGSSASLNVSIAGAVDGDSAFSFSKAPDSDIPGGLSNPDHIVDWVIKSSDRAGNVALSDADPSDSAIDLPTVKIDKVLPTFTSTASDHKTGLGTSASGEVVARNSLRVAFNDKVTNVQASDFTVTLDSTAIIAPTSVTVLNDLTGTFTTGNTPGSSAQSVVYLTFANDLVSNDTPQVSLQDTISDLAGNFTSQGDREVADGVAPSITVTLSGGSGTGATLASGEGPDKLTNNKITITIESDEPLSGPPSVAIHEDGEASAEANPVALAQGTNKWSAEYVKPGSPTDGKRAVKISTTDTASNSGTVGSINAGDSGTPNFLLDTSLATPDLTVGGGSNTTDQTRPSIVIDYKNASPAEASTVTLTKVQLDGADITSDVVAASDGKRFFYIPPADLSLGEHKLLIEAGDASDAAGNENGTDTTLTVTVQERSTFNLDMFAGWNAISFPSDPIDPDLNSVFTNAGHDAVLGFDPSVPGGWRVAVRDTVSGMLESATEGGLTSARSTQAYWVHSNNFEQVSVLLTGEVLPAAGSPPGIVTIPTVSGFNAVPIVDTDRKQTTGSPEQLMRETDGAPEAVDVASYLGSVSEGRVYQWNPEVLSFELLDGSDAVNTGSVLFVEVTGTPTPIFP